MQDEIIYKCTLCTISDNFIYDESLSKNDNIVKDKEKNKINKCMDIMVTKMPDSSDVQEILTGISIPLFKEALLINDNDSNEISFSFTIDSSYYIIIKEYYSFNNNTGRVVFKYSNLDYNKATLGELREYIIKHKDIDNYQMDLLNIIVDSKKRFKESLSKSDREDLRIATKEDVQKILKQYIKK